MAGSSAASQRKPYVSDSSMADDRRTTAAASPSAAAPVAFYSPYGSSRNSPYLPTPTERIMLVVFPVLLLFGAVFSVVSPETREASAADAATTPPPSYFARKDNLVNVLFVKRGWFWISATFAAFVATHPFYHAAAKTATAATAAATAAATGATTEWWKRRRVRQAAVRWALVTGWWILVTQWCFGPALIDRSFRLTGGGCEAVVDAADAAAAANAADAAARGGVGGGGDEHVLRGLALAATAAACKRGGGRWHGGHDISGHVFMLVLGSVFLAQELGWVLWRGEQEQQQAKWAGRALPPLTEAELRVRRSVVMADGTVRSAEVELDDVSTPTTAAATPTVGGGAAGAAGTAGAGAGAGPVDPWLVAAALVVRLATTVEALCIWMLLMTAIYFHTWFEKATGLLVAVAGFYGVYIVPRWAPAVRRMVGVPGV